MKPHKKAIDSLYSTKEELLIVGLTGRTGAGCSTVAKILKRPLEEMDFEYVDRPEWSKGDQYKFDIIKEYISKDEHWVPFDVIEGSCVILSYVFEGTNVKKAPLDEIGRAHV